jgi:V8-like Glu-specific endopeptidase
MLISCGKKESSSADGFSVTQSSIIVGSLDWYEVTELKSNSSIRNSSKSVAHVDLPSMGSRCTGFLISNDVLMTNQHCIPSSFYARGVTASFNYEQGTPLGTEERFDCSEFIGNNQELDFALLKCKGEPGKKYGFVQLSDSSVDEGDQIYVVQQNCDYYKDRNCLFTKKVSHGDVLDTSNEVAHNADTLGGSSGSPVFSESGHKVVAIHHAGLGNDGAGRGVENYAVPMSKIVPYIKSKFPQVLGGGSSSTGPNNDTPEGATSLSMNKVMNGSISSTKDLDYFKVTLKKTENIEIKLEIEGSADLDLYVYSSSQKLLAKSESTKSQEVIAGRASATTYYILVKGYRGAKSSYKLSVKN